MEQTKIKDIPMLTPDGLAIKEGMTLYFAEAKQVSRYDRGESYVKPHSGKTRGYIEEHTVIAVYPAANQRSFVSRCSKNCEHTYSVKNACLPPKIFGKKANAVLKLKEYDTEDLMALDDRIAYSLERIKEEQENIVKYEKTKKMLMK